MLTTISPVKPVSRSWTALGLVPAPVVKNAGAGVQPSAVAVKFTVSEKPAGGDPVEACATRGVAPTVIVLRDVQKVPWSTLGGADRSVRRKPVERSTRTPTAKTPLSSERVPAVQRTGTLPVTGNGPDTAVSDCAEAAPEAGAKGGGKRGTGPKCTFFMFFLLAPPIRRRPGRG